MHNPDYDSNDCAPNPPDTFPKIVFQTWKTKQIPDKWKASPLSIKQFLPNWKYVLFDDEDNMNFVKEYFPKFLPHFQSFKHSIQRADAIRYLFLYVHGGLYMDLDFCLNKNPEEIIEHFGKETYPKTNLYLVEYKKNGKNAVTNSFIISTPRHPFWMDVLKQMQEPIPWYAKMTKFTEVYESTGPSMLTKVYNEKYKNKLFGSTIYLLSEKYICTKGQRFLTPSSLTHSYIKNLEQTSGESWHGLTEKIISVIGYNKGLILFFFLLILVFVFILLIKNKIIKFEN